ncbi:Maf family protein [Amphibiibacter pelophylacis]|uniref:Maf family protein n=1 Tax=Amphibiibacter pelophylacis TaxID=1799477 RepID=A0ACC6NZL2_9BURK
MNTPASSADGSRLDPGFDLYLASQSPRRRDLLDSIAVRYRLLLAGPDEDAEALEAVRPGDTPAVYVQRVARLKGEAARQRLSRLQAQHGVAAWPAAPVLAADTTVALDGRILGKPQDDSEALAMLTALAGRSHEVYTAVWLDGQQRLSTSRVTWSAVPQDALRAYVASGEPAGKAGAYAIQGRAARWISRIEGSHSGIVGLPLFELDQLLTSGK